MTDQVPPRLPRSTDDTGEQDCLETLALVVDRYPGPGLLLDGGHHVLAVNALADDLFSADEAGLGSLIAWMEAGTWRGRPSFSARLKGAAGERAIDWVATELPDVPAVLLLGRETTFERQLRRTLTESRQRYKDLVDISSDFAWETGADGRFQFISPRGGLGYSTEALVNRHPSDLLSAGTDWVTLPFLTRRPIENIETWMQAADGHPVCLAVSALPILGSDGSWQGARGVCRDITDQVNRSFELARAQLGRTLLEHVIETLRDRIDGGQPLDDAAEETALVLNASACRMYRTHVNGSLSPYACFGIAPADADAFAERLLGEDGLHQEMLGNCLAMGGRSLFRGRPNGAVVVFRDQVSIDWGPDDLALLTGITNGVGVAVARLSHTEWLRHLSERDGLTGLFNRHTFLERLEEQLQRADAGSSSLMYIDLDNFKAVNDRLGHRQGDQVLREVAALLSERIRPGDLPCRLGGDEFLLWLGRTDELMAAKVATRLLSAVADLQRFSASPDRPLGLSIGIALWQPQSAESPQSLIDRADHAMYQAKGRGKNTFELAHPYHHPRGPGSSATGGA